MQRTRRSIIALVCALGTIAGGTMTARGAGIDPGPTPKAICGPGSDPETGLQGRVSADDVASGRAADGSRCNTEMVGRFGYTGTPGGSGGFRVHRYVDAAGHECGFYDSTLLFPLNATTQQENLTGVYVLDMRDPARPVKTATLLTPAMQTPHESLSLNVARGLLGAVAGYPTFQPGIVDIYDVSQDCLHPTLRSSTPLGILGHEATFSPDGKTFYASSTGGRTIVALDVTDPGLPVPVWTSLGYSAHGMNVSDDGTKLYVADTGTGTSGLTILDVSQVQARVPNPQVPQVAHLTWPEVSIPQTAIPVTIGGAPYLVEIDEFARNADSGNPNAPVGAARIIDIADVAHPRVVSNLRLEVNMPEHMTETRGDPGATWQLQGYTGHYCAVPRRAEPNIVACSFILSGLRIFDIRDPAAPKEIAYFNGPLSPTHAFATEGGSYAMSAPAFDPATGDIWYSDGNSGFYAVRVTNGAYLH